MKSVKMFICSMQILSHAAFSSATRWQMFVFAGLPRRLGFIRKAEFWFRAKSGLIPPELSLEVPQLRKPL